MKPDLQIIKRSFALLNLQKICRRIELLEIPELTKVLDQANRSENKRFRKLRT